MRTRTAVVLSCVGVVLAGAAAPAQAQYGAQSSASRATGENYHVEVMGALWNPSPNILITSESIEGILGTPIDFVTDLGIEQNWFTQIRIVARAATKHKFRFEFTPIRYDAESRLTRDVIFNGIRFPITLDVATEVKWNAYRFGYEWDFVYRDRGFVGLLLELKYTDVNASLTNVIDSEFVHAQAPIPAVGIIGRGYVAPNISITGEFSFFKVPNFDEDYGGNYFDFDLYGTVNFNDNVGVQGGYRSFDVFYKIENDEGDLTMKGLYFGGVVRF